MSSISVFNLRRKKPNLDILLHFTVTDFFFGFHPRRPPGILFKIVFQGFNAELVVGGNEDRREGEGCILPSVCWVSPRDWQWYCIILISSLQDLFSYLLTAYHLYLLRPGLPFLICTPHLPFRNCKKRGILCMGGGDIQHQDSGLIRDNSEGGEGRRGFLLHE